MTLMTLMTLMQWYRISLKQGCLLIWPKIQLIVTVLFHRSPDLLSLYFIRQINHNYNTN